jgi:hypothetical protein
MKSPPDRDSFFSFFLFFCGSVKGVSLRFIDHFLHINGYEHPPGLLHLKCSSVIGGDVGQVMGCVVICWWEGWRLWSRALL